MTERDDLARRVAKRLAFRIWPSGRVSTARGTAIPDHVWDALISSELRCELLQANVRKAVDILGDCSDGWKARCEKAEQRVEELEKAHQEYHEWLSAVGSSVCEFCEALERC